MLPFSPASISEPTPLPIPAESWKMFDRIAPTYDALNRLLSAGIDRRWRRAVAGELPPAPRQLRLLDVATGTGDQLLELLEAAPGRFAAATGIDPAAAMLARARTKPRPRLLGAPRPQWIEGSVLDLPWDGAAFDVATMSFGIRNVADPVAGLREIRRVLVPGGRALILEFALPEQAAVRAAYLTYFRHVLPFLGGLVSGDGPAYRYLNRTVEEFPSGEDFLDWMTQAGFVRPRFHALTFGIACLYVGEVPAEAA
jgi:demethylmenaquinone methyltransferase/2-methoxy-6-polyprenyl-1,4-benzoquinol methylase